MKEHSIRASDAQFIRLFRWIAGLQISSDAKLLFARLLDLADGDQNVKASGDFCERGFPGAMPAYVERRVNWRNLDGFTESHPSHQRAIAGATEWILPRIVIRRSETVRLEGVSYTGHGVPYKDTVSRTGQSKTT